MWLPAGADWDDQEAACYAKCVPYCESADMCRNETARDKSADAPDLDDACPARASASASAGARCTAAACKTWANFCDEWDDQQAACYAKCVPYCESADVCRNETARDKSADAPDLDEACPARKPLVLTFVGTD